VLIVDDENDIRTLLRVWVDVEADLELAGEVDHGADAVPMATSLRPDIVVLDLEMPGVSGLEALPELLSIEPPPAVVVYSIDGRARTRALSMGAVAFVDKREPVRTLFDAVRDAGTTPDQKRS
jgi:DNA-binding NarL/FixJ family response regulator